MTPGAIQPSYAGGSRDGFVAKISASGSALLWSTYLGGSGLDQAYSAGTDLQGDVYVTGYTDSSNLPVKDARQATYGGGTDAFLARYSAAGDKLVFLTYHGGAGWDNGFRVRVDSSGSAYLCGSTGSATAPTSGTRGTSPRAWRWASGAWHAARAGRGSSGPRDRGAP